MNFENLGISEEILKSIKELGFEKPTKIQSYAIPMIYQGGDIIAQSYTGTGKTAAFAIPIIDKVNTSLNFIQTLILAPTRELVIQITEEIKKLSRYKKGIKVVPIYGGQSIDIQIKNLKRHPNIIVATPGRLIDHLKRQNINLNNIKIVVLDEADKMLDMGFIDEVKQILDSINSIDKQTILLSATIPEEIFDLSRKFLKTPKIINTIENNDSLIIPDIEQYYYETKINNKVETLIKLLDFYDPELSLIFVNTKIQAEELKEKLHNYGYQVEALHGDMKQTQRDYVMKRFRNKNIKVLIATDLASRGLDIDNIKIVFNFDVPQDLEYYVHRIGRTARAGKKGLAISLVSFSDLKRLKDIIRFTKTKIIRKELPSTKEIKERKLDIFVNSIKEIINNEELDNYKDIVKNYFSDYNIDDVAAALFKNNFKNNSIEIENNNSMDDEENDNRVKLFINIGKKDFINLKEFLKFIKAKTGISINNIKNVRMLDKYSFFTVKSKYVLDIINILNRMKIRDRNISVEISYENN